MSTQSIFINDLMIQTSIGIYPDEKAALQPIRLTVEVMVKEFPENMMDEIENVLSYEDVHNVITHHVKSRHFNLVETLAEELATLILNFSQAISVTLKIEKFNKFENTGTVGVSITRP